MAEGTRDQGRGVGGKSPRNAAWLAWSLYGLIICLAIVWPAGAALLNQDGSKNVLQFVGKALVSLATPVVFAIVAALILSRQPRNTIGWLLMVPVGVQAVSVMASKEQAAKARIFMARIVVGALDGA